MCDSLHRFLPSNSSVVNGEVRKIDVIENSQSIIVYSRKGYIKRMSVEAFAVQSVRGIGKGSNYFSNRVDCLFLRLKHTTIATGKVGTRLKDEDTVEDVIYVNAHDRLLFFTIEGQVHALDAYEIPESSRIAVGTAITQVNGNNGECFTSVVVFCIKYRSSA